MPQRVRKLVGGVLMVAFLFAYAAGAIMLAERIPSFWAVKLAYFVLAGVAWGAPLVPLIAWMNRGR